MSETPLTDQALDAAKHGELTASVETEGQTTTGEVAVKAGGESWWVRAWGKATTQPGAKSRWSAGAEVTKRWFTGGEK